MSTTAYMGVLFLCAALYSLSVTLADKSHGPMGLALASCVGILLLSSIGYLDWRSQPRGGNGPLDVSDRLGARVDCCLVCDRAA